MNDQERISLHDALIEANRALIDATELNLTGRKSLSDRVINHCLTAYGDLLHCQGTIPLSPDESASVQKVLDRLSEQLKFNGINV